MNVPMAAGSDGGNGVASEGTTHAKTMLREINQLISFTLRVDIFPLAHPGSSLKRNQNPLQVHWLVLRSNNILLFFNNDRSIRVAQRAFHYPCHHVVAFRSRRSCIKNHL